MNEINNGQEQWLWGQGYNGGYYGGNVYQGQPAQPKMTNPLTEEERKALKNNNAFTLQVTPQELAQAICTHKHPENGNYATVANNDGTVTCSICHRTFDPNAVASVDYVKDVTNSFVNVLETCKLIGLDLGPEVIRGIFQMTPFVEKIPELFKIAQNSFIKYNDGVNTGYNTVSPNTMNMYSQIMTGMPMMPPQPPMMGGAMPYAQTAQYPYQPQQQTPIMNPQQMTPYANMQYNMVPNGQSPLYANVAQQQPMNNVNIPTTGDGSTKSNNEVIVPTNMSL